MDFKTTAFLGPTGTYTELALKQALPNTKPICKTSFADIFEAVASKEVDAGFVPIENIQNGPVTQTLDLLLEYLGHVYIKSSYVMEINHTLGVLKGRKGVTLDKITSIYAHSQSINQCSKYLRENFADANHIYTESNSLALKIVKEQKKENSAVIASLETLVEYGFEIIAKDISNVSNNKTRFIILKNGNISDANELYKKHLVEAPKENKIYVTSIAIDPKRDRKELLYDILTVISIKHSVNMLSIHSRPRTNGDFVFFLDLEGHAYQERIKKCLLGLKEYCLSVTDNDTEISVLGSYEHESFRPRPFNKVGIIGGNGSMGKWFNKFFKEAGYPVISTDIGEKITLKEVVKECDVILLSVPMSEANSIAKQVIKHINNSKLIVENCSIKNSVLPNLKTKLPKGVEVLGIHTMFGPSVSSIKGEQVIITKTSSSKQKSKAFEDLLYKHGAKIGHSGIEEHDLAVAYMQSLQHLIFIALAKVAKTVFKDKDHLYSFQTRNSREVMELIQRVLTQSNSLITDLQFLNPKSVKIRQEFLETITDLIKNVNQNNKEQILKEVNEARSFFNESKEE